MSIAHKHCELIKAWADGAEIEILSDDEWCFIKHPSWYKNTEYRIKPAESKLDTLREAWMDAFQVYCAEINKGVK
jgi:hypothetical protein